MQRKPPHEFLDWASARGIALDRRYGPPETLIYQPTYCSVAVSLPDAQTMWWGLMHSLMALVPGDDDLWLWRRGQDVLPRLRYPDPTFKSGIYAIFEALGVVGPVGALLFEGPRERETLKVLAMLNATVSGHQHDEWFVVPTSARVILWFDSDDLVLILTRSVEDRRSVEHHLTQNGILIERNNPILKPDPGPDSGGI